MFDFSSILGMVNKIIDRLIPDKAAAAKAKQELMMLDAQGDFDLLKRQIEVNVAEAASKSVFVAGWRPFIGWVCGVAFAYHYILQPLLIFVCELFGKSVPLPLFNLESLLTVLVGMLGLGGLRTYEKLKGVARDALQVPDKLIPPPSEGK